MTMKTFSILLLASATDAFTAPTTQSIIETPQSSSTALNHIDTRKQIPPQELGIWLQSCQDPSGNYVPCDAISGHERRAMWQTYAPPHGSPTNYGAIGCPGGGDWCYASSYGAAGPIPENAHAKKKAATVVAALAGLGKGVGGAREEGVGVSIKSGLVGGAQSAPALPSSVSSSGSSVSGEDVREARTSYAPYTTHEGRVGTLGEIGSGGGPYASKIAMPSGKQVGSTGDYFSALGGFSEPPPPKRYGLGSWKK